MARRETDLAEQKLTSLFKVAENNILESETDFEAILDGIFSGSNCVRSTIQDKNIHTDTFFLHMVPHEQVLKMNFKALFDDLLTDNQMTKVARSAYE
uniref:Uncharacterized protein n=1 Tax=Romanomermis culicivorax TaxID=13658 RepID=A0A915KPN5_ROMCU